jgi:antitoxin component YwqK of YwqJK toxin-antitoxin module
MKTLIYTFALAVITTVTGYSQIIEGEDGRYYADNYTPYEGEYKEFHNNGEPRIEMNLEDGLQHGTTNIFFPNGKINEVRSYNMGKMDGTWITYNQKNVKIAEANYLNDKKHGAWKIWDDSGTLRYQMQYNKGKRVGKWLRWDENGNLIDSREY